MTYQAPGTEPVLRVAYRALCAQKRWHEYGERFCAEAVDWVLEADFHSLLNHLGPLQALHATPSSLPRLPLLRAIGDPEADPETLEQFHQQMLELGDLDAAVAALSTAFIHHTATGQFDRYEDWDRKVRGLLAREDLSDRAEASLCTTAGLAEFAGHGDMVRYRSLFGRGLEAAERANSPSVRLFCIVGLSYYDMFSADLAALEARMLDAQALCEHPDTPDLPVAQLYSFRAMERAYAGAPRESLQILHKLQFAPGADRLPEALKLLLACHKLLATASSGATVETDEIVRGLSTRTLPQQRHFYHSYVHLNVGIAALLTRRPAVALSHVEEAAVRGRQAHSAHVVRVAAYIRGHALADLHRADDALRHWEKWHERWLDCGYVLFAAAADVARASLLSERGERVAARRALGQARTTMPSGADPLVPFRPLDTFARVQAEVIPPQISAWLSPAAPIQIWAFGPLRLEVDGHQVPLRGHRSRTLLAAVLAQGGAGIRTRELCDRLWPDADGDRAEGNLKVAVHRLRRLAGATLDEPYPWLTVQDRQVSLDPMLCAVDSLAFRDAAARALRQGDPEAMVSALALYGPLDHSGSGDEPWLADHRRELTDDYARVALALGQALLSGDGDLACLQPFLHAAYHLPGREALQLLVIQLHISRGYPSEALEVYQRTERALREEFGVEPGSALRQCLSLIQTGEDP